MSNIFSKCPQTHTHTHMCWYLIECMNECMTSQWFYCAIYSAYLSTASCRRWWACKTNVAAASSENRQQRKSVTLTRAHTEQRVLTVWQSIMSSSWNVHTPRPMAMAFRATIDLQCRICPQQTSQETQTGFVICTAERSIKVRLLPTDRVTVSWNCGVQLNFRWSPNWLLMCDRPLTLPVLLPLFRLHALNNTYKKYDKCFVLGVWQAAPRGGDFVETFRNLLLILFYISSACCCYSFISTDNDLFCWWHQLSVKSKIKKLQKDKKKRMSSALKISNRYYHHMCAS